MPRHRILERKDRTVGNSLLSSWQLLLEQTEIPSNHLVGKMNYIADLFSVFCADLQKYPYLAEGFSIYYKKFHLYSKIIVSSNKKEGYEYCLFSFVARYGFRLLDLLQVDHRQYHEDRFCGEIFWPGWHVYALEASRSRPHHRQFLYTFSVISILN